MKSRSPPRELRRDQAESSFTPILRRVFDADSRVLFVVFVDTEGECIDYVSALDPFEAKVAGAHCLVLFDALRDSRERLRAGVAHTLEIVTEQSELWARRVSEEYTVVLLSEQGADRDHLQGVLLSACRAFRAEVGIDLPVWERPQPGADPTELRVSVRPAIGWGYAPSAFARTGEQVEIADVLGRWEERDGRAPRVCFRVRTTDGRELTLIHDSVGDTWSVSL